MKRVEKLTPPLTAPELLAIFKDVQGYLEGHFIYTSGRHGRIYFNKDAIYPHVLLVSKICQEMAHQSRDYRPDVVVGPALGGIVLAHGVAGSLTKMLGQEVLALYTEKDATGKQILTRGYDQLIANRKVLIVEDVLTTGGSVLQVKQNMESYGGQVEAIFSMVNRNPNLVTAATLGTHYHSLLEMEVTSYDSADCPLCHSGIPIDTKVGKGKLR